MDRKRAVWCVAVLAAASLASPDCRAQKPNSEAAGGPAKRAAGDPSSEVRRKAVASYARLPLGFEANRGQTDPQVKFLSRGSGYTLFLTPSEAVLALQKSFVNNKLRNRPDPLERFAEEPGPDDAPPEVIRMKLLGARLHPEVSGTEELPGRSSYFIGNDPKKWRTDVTSYAKVQYREIYAGVDMVYHGNQRQLEYDFVVAPGADPKAIALAVEGAEKLELSPDGDLVLHTRGGSLRLQKPLIYQQAGDTRREISGGFLLKSKHRVGFQVGPYDLTKPLVIDPVLSYSTYLGGKGDENSSASTGGLVTGGIAVDSAGNAYVTGYTLSTDFPTVGPPGLLPLQRCGTPAGTLPLTCNINQPKVFISKLDTGGKLVYSTYLGGNGSDLPSPSSLGGIAVDVPGNVYVTGSTTSTDFPTTPGAFKRDFPIGCGGGVAIPCGEQAFVTKLAASGSSLVFSTYLGGKRANLQPATDQGADLKVDSFGNVYVTGFTDSTDFPTTTSVFQAAPRGFGGSAFVTQLNAAGTALNYSTYLGGSDGDSGSRIAVDSSGNAYVTGTTSSRDFPTTRASFQPDATSGGVFKTLDGGAKWNPSNGSGLQALTHLVVLSLAAVSVPPPPPIGGPPLPPTTTLFAGTGGGGVFKSTDGGNNWNAANTGLTPINITALAIDLKSPPTTPTVYAGSGARGVFKTENGGTSWLPVNTGLTDGRIRALAINPATTGTTAIIYAGTASGVFKTITGGSTWTAASTGLPPGNVFALAIDPKVPATVYAGTRFGVFKTTNGGTSWSSLATATSGLPPVGIRALAIDPITPATVYAGTFGGGAGVFKTNDGGTTWLPVNTNLPPINVRALAIDPKAPATLYAGATNGGVFKTDDGGKQWRGVNNGVALSIRALAIDPNVSATVYAGTVLFDGFVTKLDSKGSTQLYSTFLGGLGADFPGGIALGPPGCGSALALPCNAYVTGTTISPDFPKTPTAFQPTPQGGFDAFVSKLNPAGSALTYSTYLGGSGNDFGYDIAIDASGNAYVAGSTNSLNFPVKNPFRPALATQSSCGGLPGTQVPCSDGFVAKLNPANPATDQLLFSTYLGGDDQTEALGIALDNASRQNVYVTGYTNSTDFPTVNALQPALAGGADAFVLKISDPVTPVPIQADLAFTDHRHFPAQAKVGETLTFTVEITNKGPAPATGVTMYVTGLGSAGDVALVSATPTPSTQGRCLPAGPQSKLFCALGTLALNAKVTVTIVTTPVRAGDFVGTVAVGGNESDPDPTNNTATETVFISPTTVAACTKTYTAGVMGLWENAANWTPAPGTPPGVPASTDVACIPAFSTVTISTATPAVSIKALNNLGTLNVTGSSLTLATESASSFTNLSGGTLTANGPLTLGGAFVLSGGTFNGAGNVTLGGLFNWTGGTISGTGALTVAPGATFTVSGTGSKVVSGRTFNNNGTVNVNSGTLRLQAPAANTHSGAFSVRTGATLDFGGGTHNLNGGSTVSGAGTVSVSSGTVNFNAGSAYNVTGTTSVIVSTANFTGTVISLGATFNVNEGTANLSRIAPTSPPLSVAKFNLTSGGRLSGTTELTVTGLLTWTSGTMSGTGVTNANGGITFGGSTVTLDGRTLNNRGVGTLDGFSSLSMSNGATFNNLVAGTFNLNNDNGILAFGTGVASTFSNAGTFNRGTTTGIGTVNVVFNNTGTVNVNSGTLRLSSPIASSNTHSGAFNVSAGTTLDFGGGTHNLTVASSVTGGGTVAFSGGTVNVAGSYNVTGTTIVGTGFAGPTVNFTGTTASLGAAFRLNAGVANLSRTAPAGPLSVTTFEFNGGTLSGTTDLIVTGPMTWSGNGTMTGTGVTNVNGGITLSGQGGILDGRMLNNNGALTTSGLNATLTLTRGATLHNNGTATVNTLLALSSGATFNNHFEGTFNLNGDGGIRSSGVPPSTFVNAGTFNHAGTATGLTNVDVAFNNSGTVNTTSGALSFTAGYTQTAGRTVLNGGRIISSVGTMGINGGILAGRGSVTGNVATATGGAISPGLSPGIITIAGNYAQSATGVYNAKIGGTVPGQLFDQVNITGAGTVSLSGTLNVTLIPGFMPAAGDTFTILTCAATSCLTGKFTTTNLPALTGGLIWIVKYNPTSVVLSVLAGECPANTTITWTTAGGGEWRTASNWNPARVPNATDNVCIGTPFAATTVTLSSGPQTIKSLAAKSKFVMSGGSSLAIAATSVLANDFTLNNATLSGAGNVTITGLFSWSGGTMSGA